MQNAGQYVPGAASAHQTQQFAPSEPSPNGGSTTSSLRQFRKRDVDKTQLEQPPKQESHVARVAPHNHYPPASNDLYRYQTHQFSEYSPQVKYSDIADASQQNPISTSVIQKPKPKDYMEMCNVQQQHMNNQQQYSPDNGQYMHRDPSQGFPSSAHYLPKDQHQYQQLGHHPSQSKFNTMMTQNMSKYNPGHTDNPFLNKLRKIHPSMARSIMSDHHALQEPQPSFSPMDQRAMYAQQSHRFYTASSMHQPNPYAPNPNYAMNPSHHYPNYASASCSFPRTPTMPQRYPPMERSMSPTRRGYSENMPMNHLQYHNMHQKMPTAHNYNPQYNATPEYAQHYQHRRMATDCYPQSCRPTQYMQNHHQMPAQEMQELSESRISPSDSLKKFIENWAADEEPTNEINPMESNVNLRDNIKLRDDAPPGTVYMINATDVENYGIPIVTSDNGGIQLTSENYQYLLKNGLVDNSGMVRIIEANKDVSIGPNGNPERVVNLQIMEAPKSDCMMNNKNMRLNDGIAPNGAMPSKPENETRRVVIHQNTVITPGNSATNDGVPNHQSVNQASIGDQIVESISISKELVDKNCSPINLDQLEQNLGFSEPEPSETENIKNNSVPGNSIDPLINGNENKSSFKDNEISLSDDLSQHSNDSRSPGSKSMPIIDLFGESHVEENDLRDLHNNISDNTQNKAKTAVGNDKTGGTNQEMEVLPEVSLKQEKKDVNDSPFRKEICSMEENEAVFSPTEEKPKHKLGLENSVEDPLVSTSCKSNSNSNNFKNSVIVSPETIKREDPQNEDKNWLENTDLKNILDNEKSSQFSKLSMIECKKEIGKEIKHTEDDPIIQQHTDNTDGENQSTTINRKTPSPEVLTTTLQRRKRIFSVDDIIHHIGNNLKRGSKELESFCSPETMTHFIEKEVEFSSLEQIHSLSTKNSLKQPTISATLDTITQNKTNEVKESSCTFQDLSCFKTADDSEMLDLTPETKEIQVTEMNSIANKELESKKEESVTEIESNTKCESDEIFLENSTLASPSNASIQVQQESEDRTDTPNNFQYRNALRVEETSVLLQIAGELMEISVNIVNGKKVITVVPLSETTVVDYNDNYEVSSNVQDIVQLNDSGELDDSGIETEQVENSQKEREEQNEKIACDESITLFDKDIPINQQIKACDVTSENTQDIEMHEEPVKNNEIKEHCNTSESAPVLTETKNDIPKESQIINNNTNLDNNSLNDDEICQELKPENPNESKNEVEIDSKNNTLVLHSVSETDNNEPNTTFQSDQIDEHSNSIESEKNKEEGDVIYDVLETTETNNEQIIEDIHILQTSTIEEKLIKTKDTDKLENICSNNYTNTDGTYAGNNLDSSSDLINKTVNVENETIENLLETEKTENDFKKNESIQCVENDYTKTDNERSPITNIDTCEQDETETDMNQLEYQLEDDVFISEEPPHEIIVSDPLDGVGLIEEIDKTSDSFDIPLEPVTTSNETLTTEEPSFTKALAVVEPKHDAADRDLGSVMETNITENDNHANQTIESLEIPNSLEHVKSPQPVTEIKEETHVDELNFVTPIPGDSPRPKLELNRELIVKLSKPEIQILSPTSTNLDDHFTTSKENVYLEPRRKYSTDNDVSESTATTIATKAAKKLYECDLQIPAVTTSGDVSHKSGKKTKHRPDTVSSSEKKRRGKESSRNKISSLKRSKRINDKIQTKNEQKEILRLLVEKRKQKMEFKQKTDVVITEENDNPVKNNEEKEAKNSKQSTENDDEYVDFKELLRARKLRKLKKLQERKAFNESSNKTDKANKDKILNVNISPTSKVHNENKLALVSTSHPVEKKTETKKECCVGCNYEVKKSNSSKDEKPKISKRKSSETNEFSNVEKPKNSKVLKTEIPSAAFDQISVNLNLQTSVVTETKPTNLESEKTMVNNKSNSDKTPDIDTVKSPAKIETNNLKQTPISALYRDKESAEKIKTIRQNRVSFSSDVSINDAPLNNAHSANPSSKTKTHSLPKDPRRHSRSYSGQVMVPSVSELIEENCAPSKKKITLADYVSRKRKTSSDECGKSKFEDKDAASKKYRYDKRESVESAPSGNNTEESTKPLPKTVRDIKTSFVIHSSDWEDSQSPIPTTIQSNDECLIQNFSGLIEHGSKKPVIDVNELISVESPKNPKDKKLQEYKDKVDSQLSSLNIQIPNKVKAPSLENKPTNLTWDYGSPENNDLIKKFLSSEKITPGELEKIKKIISYKRLMQNQKNALSPSKSPMPTSSEYNQNLPHLNQEIIETPFSSGLAYSKIQPDPTYEIKNFGRLETDSKEMRLHLKKVNGKRKLQLESDEPNSSSVHPNQSESRHKPNVDYSVFNRLGKDGLPKIIFKRNRQSNISDDNQPVVALERIDDKLDEVEEKYKVTVTQMM